MKKFILLFLLGSSLSFGCYSDVDCGAGNECVKGMFESEGDCMKSVDEFGIQQYNTPSTQNLSPKLSGSCNFNSDCPIGFRCDSYYKECVR